MASAGPDLLLLGLLPHGRHEGPQSQLRFPPVLNHRSPGFPGRHDRCTRQAAHRRSGAERSHQSWTSAAGLPRMVSGKTSVGGPSLFDEASGCPGSSPGFVATASAGRATGLCVQTTRAALTSGSAHQWTPHPIRPALRRLGRAPSPRGPARSRSCVASDFRESPQLQRESRGTAESCVSSWAVASAAANRLPHRDWTSAIRIRNRGSVGMESWPGAGASAQGVLLRPSIGSLDQGQTPGLFASWLSVSAESPCSQAASTTSGCSPIARRGSGQDRRDPSRVRRAPIVVASAPSLSRASGRSTRDRRPRRPTAPDHGAAPPGRGDRGRDRLPLWRATVRPRSRRPNAARVSGMLRLSRP